MKIAVEMAIVFRYKLRMMGVPINEPTDTFCDNQSVTNNASIPHSVLNKRHNAICYHRVREAQAANIIRVAWINGEYNQADLSTKTTISTKRKSLPPKTSSQRRSNFLRVSLRCSKRSGRLTTSPY